MPTGAGLEFEEPAFTVEKPQDAYHDQMKDEPAKIHNPPGNNLAQPISATPCGLRAGASRKQIR